jgi:hypothetical protein
LPTRLEVVLVSGERRIVEIPVHAGSIATALDRLEDWIRTVDGTWLQKHHVVEARPVAGETLAESETTRLTWAAGELTDSARDL